MKSVWCYGVDVKYEDTELEVTEMHFIRIGVATSAWKVFTVVQKCLDWSEPAVL